MTMKVRNKLEELGITDSIMTDTFGYEVYTIITNSRNKAYLGSSLRFNNLIYKSYHPEFKTRDFLIKMKVRL